MQEMKGKKAFSTCMSLSLEPQVTSTTADVRPRETTTEPSAESANSRLTSNDVTEDEVTEQLPLGETVEESKEGTSGETGRSSAATEYVQGDMSLNDCPSHSGEDEEQRRSASSHVERGPFSLSEPGERACYQTRSALSSMLL